MAIKLLALGTGHLCLEFEQEKISDVSKAITTLFGKATQTRYVMAGEVRFGGARFTFYNEWHDPCLISASRKGDECLRQVFAKVSTA